MSRRILWADNKFMNAKINMKTFSKMRRASSFAQNKTQLIRFPVVFATYSDFLFASLCFVCFL